MASPFPKRGLARLRRILLQPFALALMGIWLCGCSFDLGSLTPEKENPQKVEPLLGRATSYLALGKAKEAAADLDEASEADPHNAQVWTIRGQAYERLGDRTKAAASYTKAVSLRPRDDAARSGLTRVG